MTPAEARLWMSIRRTALGVRFRRQVPIGDWIVDFACLDPKIAIEVDDRSHEMRDESVRSDYITSRGFTLLRYTNKEIAFEVNEVVAGIKERIEELRSASVPGENPPPPLSAIRRNHVPQ